MSVTLFESYHPEPDDPAALVSNDDDTVQAKPDSMPDDTNQVDQGSYDLASDPAEDPNDNQPPETAFLKTHDKQKEVPK